MTKEHAFKIADSFVSSICRKGRMRDHGAILYWSEGGLRLIANLPDSGDKFLKKNYSSVVGIYDSRVSVDMIAYDIMDFSNKLRETPL